MEYFIGIIISVIILVYIVVFIVHSLKPTDAWKQFLLGDKYFNEQEYENAVYWFGKASEKGVRLAQFALGVCYEKGLGLEINSTQAFYWCKKSAEQELEEAQDVLGKYYEQGYGVEKDIKQAIYWYERAAAQGFTKSQASLKRLS